MQKKNSEKKNFKWREKYKTVQLESRNSFGKEKNVLNFLICNRLICQSHTSHFVKFTVKCVQWLSNKSYNLQTFVVSDLYTNK